jgi:hypothetical protein
MEHHSVVEVKEAERQSKLQRLGFAHMVRIDETKATSPKDIMYLHRVRAAAAERSEAFDVMIQDRDFNRLFNEGTIYIERPGGDKALAIATDGDAVQI